MLRRHSAHSVQCVNLIKSLCDIHVHLQSRCANTSHNLIYLRAAALRSDNNSECFLPFSLSIALSEAPKERRGAQNMGTAREKERIYK